MIPIEWLLFAHMRAWLNNDSVTIEDGLRVFGAYLEKATEKDRAIKDKDKGAG
jgi:hypothetical protein